LATVVGVDMSRSGTSGTAIASPGGRKKALPEHAAQKKTKIRGAGEKNVRPKPGDIIPFDQEDKESFKDF
ncbi:MAG: hypothetical protein IH628_02590, partial [Proteobacteria bacterium]|nr:hypothetical protein [Pseudomonadota bacterium]